MSIVKLMLNRTNQALVLGFVVTVVTTVFMLGLDLVIGVFYDPDYSFYLLFALPLAALLLDFVETKFQKINSNIESVYRQARGLISESTNFIQISYAILSTWLCHLLGASVGRESLAVQVGGGIANNLYDMIPNLMSRDFFVRLGIAAAFSVAFGTPLAAAIFALEIGHRISISNPKPSKQLFWELLFMLPFTWGCDFLARKLGVNHQLFDRIAQTVGPLEISWKWLPVCFIAGLLALSTPWFYSLWSSVFRGLPRDKKRRVGTLLFVVLVFTFAGLEYTSLGTSQIESAFTRQMALQDVFWRIFLTSLCVSVFLKGGDFTPLLAAGATLGSVLAHQANLPLAQGAAVVFASILSAKHQIPLTATLLTTELFGSTFGILFLIICLSERLWSNLFIWLKHEL